MTDALPAAALDQLFRTARTYNAFSGEVSDETLHELYDLLKLGPTSANTSPARFVFVKSEAAKAKLEPALSEGNHDKTMAAPVTVIVGYRRGLPREAARSCSRTPTPRPGSTARAKAACDAAFRNGSLQGAYLILAARALGLDAGPMSGFDNAKVDEAFFQGTRSGRTSSSTSARAIPPASSPARRAWASTKPRGSSDPHISLHPHSLHAHFSGDAAMKRLALAVALSLFAASAFAAPVTYKLDPNHTDVIAQWNHFGFSNPSANFGQVDGTLVYDADDVAASSVQVTLAAGRPQHVRARARPNT